MMAKTTKTTFDNQLDGGVTQPNRAREFAATPSCWLLQAVVSMTRLLLLLIVPGVLLVGCRTNDGRQIAAWQRVLDDSGFVEIPYGFQISSFTTPPCRRVFPAVAKNPTIWLFNGLFDGTHSNVQSNVALVPVRAENGDYSLSIQKDPSDVATRLATLSEKTGLASVFLAEDGSVVKVHDQWLFALFFSSSGTGLIAWKDGHGSFSRPLLNPEGVPAIVYGINWEEGKDAPPCYRRFFLKGKKNSSGPHLLHEIWPARESYQEK